LVDGLPVAFIDWDAARPGARVDDLAYFAWTWCILDIDQVPIRDQAARLSEVREGYGIDDRVDLVQEILRVQQDSALAWRAAAAGTHGAAQKQHLVAAEWAERLRAFVDKNHAALRDG
jgi:aminoglycoside phosphotransferase (APT) family kinase protein